jgi:hypothetical protein
MKRRNKQAGQKTDSEQFTSFNTGSGYGPGWYGRGMTSSMTTGSSYTISGFA